MSKSADPTRPEASNAGSNAEPSPARKLTPAAERALAEAEERRRARAVSGAADQAPKEIGGRTGPDPTRYGDWENGGIASDF